MRRVAGNARHARPNGDVLPHNSDALSAVLQDSPQTPGRLVAHEEECALFVRQVALLMVENAAAVAHTGTGDDNLALCDFVDAFGLGCRIGHNQLGEFKDTVPAPDDFPRSCVKVIAVLFVDPGHLDSQGRI